MAKPNEILANALKALQRLQKASKAIKTSQLSRADRESLLAAGYLSPVINGWYIISNPSDQPGSSTNWFASMKDFMIAYCADRFGKQWHVSPEYSLALHAGTNIVPKQIIIHSPKGNNGVVNLPQSTSWLTYKSISAINKNDLISIDGVPALKLDIALTRVAESYFKANVTDAQILLSTINDISDIMRVLLEESKPVVAGRLAGAFRAIGNNDFADQIVMTMVSSGHKVLETNPFDTQLNPISVRRDESPYVARLKVMWSAMRQDVIDIFGNNIQPPTDVAACMKDIEDRYVADAYNSLSIEGYTVSDELIERVRTGRWNPEGESQDKEYKNAMAARGYWLAHNAVKNSIASVLGGSATPGAIFKKDHQKWFNEMFSPSVIAGILKPIDLAGYRGHQVYIRNAEHVPPPKEAVREMMPALSELLEEEPSAAVRAVLGHFMFVYIHPYMDGNGRSGRFTMNAMLVTGGYPWTVIRVDNRDQYMASLNDASARGNIKPFAQHIFDSMQIKPENDNASTRRPVKF